MSTRCCARSWVDRTLSQMAIRPRDSARSEARRTRASPRRTPRGTPSTGESTSERSSPAKRPPTAGGRYSATNMPPGPSRTRGVPPRSSRVSAWSGTDDSLRRNAADGDRREEADGIMAQSLCVLGSGIPRGDPTGALPSRFLRRAMGGAGFGVARTMRTEQRFHRNDAELNGSMRLSGPFRLSGPIGDSGQEQCEHCERRTGRANRGVLGRAMNCRFPPTICAFRSQRSTTALTHHRPNL
jgi:hypothetical protein